MRPDDRQVQLLVQAQDYLYIPGGVKHWCSPTALLNFKAVRYFVNYARLRRQYSFHPIEQVVIYLKETTSNAVFIEQFTDTTRVLFASRHR